MKNQLSLPSHFKEYLQQELAHRIQMNSRYSLRAFAKSLGLEPSLLSKLIHGKRPITEQMIQRLAPRLGLTPESQRQFLKSEQCERSFTGVPLEHIRVIADWYHFAILELIKINPDLDAKFAAKSLGLSLAEAKLALNRLENLEYIEKHKGQWRQLPNRANNTTTSHNFTEIAFQKLQEQILQQAALAMKKTNITFRDQSSMTMAISSKKIPQAKEKIKKFRRDLCAFLEEGTAIDEVYQLSISLFPITNLNPSHPTQENI
jgi:plasmid maintenance system antidote protein VapI